MNFTSPANWPGTANHTTTPNLPKMRAKMLTCRTTPNQEENLPPRAAQVKVRVARDVVREEVLLAREEERAAGEEEDAPILHV